jgi:transposase-like protein
MKKQIHKKYNAEFKAEVVREILKEEKSLSQISSEYKVHPTQLNRWKEIVILTFRKQKLSFRNYEMTKRR